MASSSSHNSGIPLATLLEWYKIQAVFCGDKMVPRNIPLALKMAASCQHPDARWLAEVCAGKDVTTAQDAKRVFSALGQNDARALCFLWLLGDPEDLAPLRCSAELGFAFAQALLAALTFGDEKFKFALLSAGHRELAGILHLGYCFRDGDGCEKNLVKAKENFLLASELGDVDAMRELGWLLDNSSPLRWHWWSQAAGHGAWRDFLTNFSEQVELFNSGSGSAAVVFVIGRALQGHVNEEARTIFRNSFNFDSLIGPAKQAIAFYEAQMKASKDALRAWTQVGIKLKVVKDVRKLIANLIWDSREEALYDVSEGREQEEHDMN